MLKKVFSLFLFALILIMGISAYASDMHRLTLNDAITMATDNSPELEICELNQQELSKQIKDAVLTQKENRNTPVYVSQNFDVIYIKKGYFVNLYKAQLGLAEKQEIQTEAKIAYDTTQKYYTLKNAQKLCEVALNGVDRATQNLNLTKEKYKLGMCTQMDVTNSEIALEEAKANLLAYQNNSDLAEDSLKIKLGIDDETIPELVDSIESVILETSLSDDISSALDSRYDVEALKVNMELAEQYYGIAAIMGTDTAKYFSAYADYLEASSNYTNGKKNITLGIKSAYYSVLNAQKATELAKKKLDYQKNQYEIHKLRFEIGMITNDVLIALSDELMLSEINYENALLEQKLAVENYNYQITIGV